MKGSFLSVFVLLTGFITAVEANGVNYYINSVAGDDTNSGISPDFSWKSLSKAGTTLLNAGDTLFFVCGSVFTGGLEIKASGLPDNPIVLTSYGSGQPPRFSNPERSVLSGNAIRLSGDYLVVDGLFFSDCAAARDNGSYTDIWDVGAIRIMLGANHCIVRNCEFSNCPKGIQSSGEYALITNNYFHSANTRPLSFPGWGPIAIHMGNSHQEVSYNIIKDYYSTGGEFGGDGGALELDDGRNPKKDIYIHHNYSCSNMGFLEVSWFADIARTETFNLRIVYNVSDDFQDFVMLWAPTHETYIENNTIFRRKHINTTIGPTVFCIDYDSVTIRNNIIAVDSVITVFINNTEGQNHTHNLYWSLDGSLPKIGTTLHPTEIYNINPQFTQDKKEEFDFSLKPISPAIDQGISINSEYKIDFLGHPVPVGERPDIGAFEFQTNTLEPYNYSKID